MELTKRIEQEPEEGILSEHLNSVFPFSDEANALLEESLDLHSKMLQNITIDGDLILDSSHLSKNHGWEMSHDLCAMFGLGSSSAPSLRSLPIPAPPRRIRPPPTMAHGKAKHIVLKASCKRARKGM